MQNVLLYMARDEGGGSMNLRITSDFAGCHVFLHRSPSSHSKTRSSSRFTPPAPRSRHQMKRPMNSQNGSTREYQGYYYGDAEIIGMSTTLKFFSLWG